MGQGFRAHAVGAVFVAFLALAPACAVAAASVDVRKLDCRTGVRLTARGAHLSEVLRKLSDSLGFELRYESIDDPVIDMEVERQPVELVRGLAPDVNLSLTQARDPDCPKRDRIVKVWVLPTGKAGIARPAPSKAPQRSAEDQASFEMFLKAHGARLRPDGTEEAIPPGP